MTTTHDKAVAAYKVLMAIGQHQAPAAVSLQLFRLKKSLRDAVDFVSEEEHKLVEAYGGKVTEEGMILIADEAKRQEFTKALTAVYKTDYEGPEKITLRASDLPELSVTDLETLDSFVDFE